MANMGGEKNNNINNNWRKVMVVVTSAQSHVECQEKTGT